MSRFFTLAVYDPTDPSRPLERVGKETFDQFSRVDRRFIQRVIHKFNAWTDEEGTDDVMVAMPEPKNGFVTLAFYDPWDAQDGVHPVDGYYDDTPESRDYLRKLIREFNELTETSPDMYRTLGVFPAPLPTQRKGGAA